MLLGVVIISVPVGSAYFICYIPCKMEVCTSLSSLPDSQQYYHLKVLVQNKQRAIQHLHDSMAHLCQCTINTQTSSKSHYCSWSLFWVSSSSVRCLHPQLISNQDSTGFRMNRPWAANSFDWGGECLGVRNNPPLERGVLGPSLRFFTN